MTTATKRTPVPEEFAGGGARMATPPQLAFIQNLANERKLDGIHPRDPQGRTNGAVLQARLDANDITFDEAKAYIPWLKGQPFKTETERGTAEIPDGYYAVQMEGHKNEHSFYRFRTGRKGTRWEGVQFMDMVVGPRYEKTTREQRRVVELAIKAAGVVDCQKRYGQLIGRCGRCNYRLTDDLSREIGLGPHCRSL